MASLTAAPLAACLVLGGCHGRTRAPSPSGQGIAASKAESPCVAELDLSGGAPEESGSNLFEKPGGSFFDLVTTLRSLGRDASVRGAFVRFDGAHVGWARAQEIGDLLAEFRKTGRPVVCHAHGYTNTTSWIAARGCDKIWVSAAGEVEVIGVAAQLVFAHRLLADKLGVDVDFLQVGKYKGAEEPFTRDGPSPEARASLAGVLAAIRRAWLDGLDARGPNLHGVAEDGPYSAEAARRRNLVDAVGDVDEARRSARDLARIDHAEVRFGAESHTHPHAEFGELVHRLAGGGRPWGGAPHVSVVQASGPIAMGGDDGLLGGARGISERGLGRILRKLADDDSARAVVLRIDSPGGSALASDLLWKQLIELRKKKPLVVSVGDMAASGGYYLASAANRIVAEPTSIVGSIGVVGGKLGFGRALEAVGVHVETVAAAQGAPAEARAAYESPFSTWDASTRRRVLEQMTAIYELFVHRVAEGRGMSNDEVGASAEGRIFAGPDAKQARLIDEWGGLDRALGAARELAHLGDDVPVRLVGQEETLWDWLGMDSDSDPEGAEGRSARFAPWARAAGGRGGLASQLGALGPAVGSMLPLVRGEHTVVALPFAVLLD